MTILNSLLQSPAVGPIVTTVFLAVLYTAVGKFGSLLEAQGAARGLVGLVVLGKKLEAIGYDGPKLKGQPGAPENGL